MKSQQEIFVSVDIEASGPIPEKYSMLSVGACVTSNPSKNFSCYLKPISKEFVPEALKVTGLSLEHLQEEGIEPIEAMTKLKVWLHSLTETEETVVFVGFNASFDWSFINYYFHKFLGGNPFGISALDIKSMYFGATNCTWKSTRSSEIAKIVKPRSLGDHNALHDAIYQAELFELIRKKFVKN
ncbi:MAG: 3'-5' exonuclease [Acetobacter aceti]|uniref:DNA polymerase III subunit epsilon n=1 Tax=Acetobacter aceti TaxID=435 RepID=A0A1U9KJD6_ACEAC|nr:3'-5' exonuclease [Acetobacter aceti]AQS85922.1 DNA polymerase III subunit epsilon [Acetobacter aceti]